MERERAFFGPYRLLRRLGGGGAGEVYLAESTQPGQDGRQVAIKILRATADNPMSQAVGRDVTRVATFDEKHIIPYRDVVADGTALGVVMAYAPGGSLGDELRQSDLVPLPLAPAIVARIVSQTARALSVAHATGITHGDLKPSNIFVRTSSHGAPIATISDFGQAFLTPLAAERASNERGDQNQWALEQLALRRARAATGRDLACDRPICARGRRLLPVDRQPHIQRRGAATPRFHCARSHHTALGAQSFTERWGRSRAATRAGETA